MMNIPIVSIIIATYNSGKTLRASLDSVHNQIFQDWECIVVDGASNDDTISIVKEYEQKDSRFRHISEPDKGIYDAFNKGWRMAKGEWVHYLGSDDKLTKESFTELVKLNDGKAAVISGACYIERENQSLCVQKSIGWNGCHQGKLTRKSLLEKYGGFNEEYKIIADADLYERMKMCGEQVINNSSIIAYFSMDGTSQKITNIHKKYKEFFHIYNIGPTNVLPLFKWTYRYVRAIMSFYFRKVFN